MTVYRAAHALARRGIPLFPCRPNAKTPCTARGLNAASTDVAVIQAWSRRWPHANLAVPMGLRSGLFAIDIDRKAQCDGLETLVALERELGPLPATLTAATASGGEHRYFRMPSATLRNSAGKLGRGVDTRGEGGYVVVPPSTIDGRLYRWTVRTALAELPSDWIHALAPQEPTRAPAAQWVPRTDAERTRVGAWCIRALQAEARSLADMPPGGRNQRLWNAASALGGLLHLGSIDAADVRSALLWACSTWSRRDARKDADTLERGLVFGLAHPRQLYLGDDRAA